MKRVLMIATLYSGWCGKAEAVPLTCEAMFHCWATRPATPPSWSRHIQTKQSKGNSEDKMTTKVKLHGIHRSTSRLALRRKWHCGLRRRTKARLEQTLQIMPELTYNQDSTSKSTSESCVPYAQVRKKLKTQPFRHTTQKKNHRTIFQQEKHVRFRYWECILLFAERGTK